MQIRLCYLHRSLNGMIHKHMNNESTGQYHNRLRVHEFDNVSMTTTCGKTAGAFEHETNETANTSF